MLIGFYVFRSFMSYINECHHLYVTNILLLQPLESHRNHLKSFSLEELISLEVSKIRLLHEIFKHVPNNGKNLVIN